MFECGCGMKFDSQSALDIHAGIVKGQPIYDGGSSIFNEVFALAMAVALLSGKGSFPRLLNHIQPAERIVFELVGSILDDELIPMMDKEAEIMRVAGILGKMTARVTDVAATLIRNRMGDTDDSVNNTKSNIDDFIKSLHIDLPKNDKSK